MNKTGEDDSYQHESEKWLGAREQNHRGLRAQTCKPPSRDQMKPNQIFVRIQPIYEKYSIDKLGFQNVNLNPIFFFFFAWLNPNVGYQFNQKLDYDENPSPNSCTLTHMHTNYNWELYYFSQ